MACLLVLLLTGPGLLPAQTPFHPWQGIPVLQGEDTLSMAWAGGLNQCQLAAMELDGQGLKDVLVFDRATQRFVALLAVGSPGNVRHRYAPEWLPDMPTGSSWTLLRDYDGDGLPDLFVGEQGGIAVYRQGGTPSAGIQFERVSQGVHALQANELAPIQVLARDLPAIADLDADGDLDILTFNLGGTRVSLFENQASQLGRPDSLTFELTDPCWGNFEEDELGFRLRLNVACGPRAARNQRHAGSTLLSLDINQDARMDLVLGDVAAPNLLLLLNAGTREEASISAQLPFPGINEAVDLPLFPAAFLLDVDQDGHEDVVVSPNAARVSENAQSIWWYRNLGLPDTMALQLAQRDLFQAAMIDVGEGAYPVAEDVDGDGLVDLVVGNYGYYQAQAGGGGQFLGRLAWFQQVGTPTQPVFRLRDRDWAGLSRLDLGPGVCPTFGDLDGDGDRDLVLGLTNGRLALLERTSAAGQPAAYELTDAHWQGIDVGQFAAPQLVDVNGDGRLDAIIGNRGGTLSYYEQQADGSGRLELKDDRWGGVEVGEESFLPGYSVPFAFRTQAGTLDLLVGNDAGRLRLYQAVSPMAGGVFQESSEEVHAIDVGSRAAPLFWDWDLDGQRELMVGNYGGGICLWRAAAAVSFAHPRADLPLRLYPNPGTDELWIKWASRDAFREPLSIWNLHGQRLATHELLPGKNRIVTASLPAGTYVLRIGPWALRWQKLR